MRTIAAIVAAIKNLIGYPAGSCRFHPTCGEYASLAVKKHGIARGGMLALWRILRCNPLGKGGSDPVP